jgi:hypothetical protein
MVTRSQDRWGSNPRRLHRPDSRTEVLGYR